MNTHIDLVNYEYRNLTTVAASIDYLGIDYLGIKNIRDRVQTAADATTWLQVANATGAKFDDHIAETSLAGMVTDLGFATRLAQAGILNFLEGGNDAVNAYSAGLANTLAIAAQFQQQVYATGHGLPVVNMSFGSGWTAADNWQGDYGAVVDLSAYTDHANARTYSHLGQGTDWTIQRLNGLAQLAAAARPVIATEIGGDENQGFAQSDIAKVSLDAVMDGIKDGDAKTYFYGLFDDGSGKFPADEFRRDTEASRHGNPLPHHTAGRCRHDRIDLRHRDARLHVGQHDRQRQRYGDAEVGSQLLGIAVERERCRAQRHSYPAGGCTVSRVRSADRHSGGVNRIGRHDDGQCFQSSCPRGDFRA